MSEKRSRREGLKSLAIVLLSVSAVLLLGKTGLYSQLMAAVPAVEQAVDKLGGISGDKTGQTELGEQGLTWSAGTVSIAVLGESGSRYAAKYDSDDIEYMYSRYSDYLGEALGSAGAPREMTEDAWREALLSPGVYFDFYYDQDLSLLARRLGTQAGENAAGYEARSLCLYRDGDGLSLCFMDTQGRKTACATALSFASISEKLSGYAGNVAVFAFQNDSLEGVYPYSLILDSMPEISSAQAANPFRTGLTGEEILGTFGINSYMANAYTEADGTLVYVDGGGILRIDPYGTVSYRNAGGDGMAVAAPSGEMDMYAAVSGALKLVKASAGARCGDAELILTDAVYNSAVDTYTVCFEYALDGIAVRAETSPAAEVQIRAGRITSAVVTYRQYTLTGEPASPLPERQAAAIVGVRGGGEPVLTYMDTAQGLSLEWRIGRVE